MGKIRFHKGILFFYLVSDSAKLNRFCYHNFLKLLTGKDFIYKDKLSVHRKVQKETNKEMFEHQQKQRSRNSTISKLLS